MDSLLGAGMMLRLVNVFVCLPPRFGFGLFGFSLHLLLLLSLSLSLLLCVLAFSFLLLCCARPFAFSPSFLFFFSFAAPEAGIILSTGGKMGMLMIALFLCLDWLRCVLCVCGVVAVFDRNFA